VAIWQHNKRVLGLFSLRIHRNANLRASGQKSDLAVRFGDLDFLDAFPLPRDVYWIYSMFLYNYVAWPFWPWPLNFRPWKSFVYSASHVRPTYQLLLLSVTELWVLNIWSHFRYLKQSLPMRRVTWPLTGGKNSPHFWNHDSNMPIQFVTFRALRRRLSHVIGEK